MTFSPLTLHPTPAQYRPSPGTWDCPPTPTPERLYHRHSHGVLFHQVTAFLRHFSHTRPVCAPTGKCKLLSCPALLRCRSLRQGPVCPGCPQCPVGVTCPVAFCSGPSPPCPSSWGAQSCISPGKSFARQLPHPKTLKTLLYFLKRSFCRCCR